MSNRFRASSSRWDWHNGGSPPTAAGSTNGQQSTQKFRVNKTNTIRGKSKETEKGFFFCSEDGHQVLVCGKDLETGDVLGKLSAMISHATVVNLSQNTIGAFPPGLPPDIIALDLSKNRLSNLYGLQCVTNLKELYLGGNIIESTWGLTVATSLEILDLSANKIRIVEGLETLINLKRLNLKYNNIKGMSSIRSLSFNKKLLVLDLSNNPVAEKNDYKRNILHLIPSLEVLDDLKIGFEMFRKNNDYTTRYLNTKHFNESRDPNDFGFLWSGRPGRWDGVVFQAAHSGNALSELEVKALSDTCQGSLITNMYGAKGEGKNYPWRREPDIPPRPLQFSSAAEEGECRAKTPIKTFSPGRSQRSGGGAPKSPTSYLEMSQDESYMNTVLSQHMERPEWHKYYKPVLIGTESKVAKQRAEEEKKRSKKNSQQMLGRSEASATWGGDDGRAVYMGGPMSPRTASSLQNPHYPEYFDYSEVGDDYAEQNEREGPPDPYFRDGDRLDQHDTGEYPNEPESNLHNDRRSNTASVISPKDLEDTVLQLVEHKKAVVRRLQEARAARGNF